VTNSVTHLVSSETGTKKCDEAEAKGAKIVDEDWVRNRIENGGGKAGDDEDKDEDEEQEEEDEEEEEEGGGKGDENTALTGMCFAISGLSPSVFSLSLSVCVIIFRQTQCPSCRIRGLHHQQRRRSGENCDPQGDSFGQVGRDPGFVSSSLTHPHSLLCVLVVVS
jgi:hypothetical protein